MWLKPGGRGMAFSATQSIAIDRIAFSWEARFRIAGPLVLSVIDDYEAEEGQLAVLLCGIPLQRERGAATVEGEALRYLAELAFAPPAVLRNSQLEWRELDGPRVEVATSVGGQRLAVAIEFDSDGNIASTSSQMRKLKVKGEWQRTPWGGRFRDYRQVGPLLLPAQAEAYWDLDSGRYVYWRANILSAELIAEPFRRPSRRRGDAASAAR